MFSSDTNHSKLKTNLRLAINRLKLLEKKKTELAQKSRKEIADYIAQGKYERAKIRVEHIIREDYMVEGLELIEMYCDLLLSRFGLIQQSKTVDPSLAEAISSLIWAAPRIENDVTELKAISDLFLTKYGKKYIEACRLESVDTISEKLKHKIGVQPPPKILVEKYLIEIAKNYNISYEPDPQVMREAEHNKGIDSLLFDGQPNNLDSNRDSVVRPTGFVDFPQPEPPLHYNAFNYPPQKSNSANLIIPPKSDDNLLPTCPLPSASINENPASYSYNILPSENKPNNVTASNNKEIKPNNKDNFLKSLPKANTSNSNSNLNLPELPSVPTDTPIVKRTFEYDKINSYTFFLKVFIFVFCFLEIYNNNNNNNNNNKIFPDIPNRKHRIEVKKH
ncbi:hypothetical protein PGB90_004776 [Kerria lacca]